MPISNRRWFCEETVPGARHRKIRHCFLIDKLVFKGKTPYQDILIFDNSIYGRVLVLDGIVQLSERDEFIYHEMISHPVLLSHPKPENILIIGGGDGGVLREVLKHPVKKVDLVEIDKKVIEISKKYLKFICKNSFSDKRAKIYNLPGEKFIKKNKNFYDIVIIDCTNFGEGGLSNLLYSIKFYKDIFFTLKKEGIMITLGASFFDFENFIKKIFKRLKKVFPSVAIFRFCMPSYHCGEYSFIAGSKKINLEKVDFGKVEKRFNKIAKKHKFLYYSPKIHQSSIVLPKIWQIK